MMGATESVATSMARLEAQADLLLERCPHCTPRREVVAMAGELPRALGIEHEEDCPLRIE